MHISYSALFVNASTLRCIVFRIKFLSSHFYCARNQNNKKSGMFYKKEWRKINCVGRIFIVQRFICSIVFRNYWRLDIIDEESVWNRSWICISSSVYFNDKWLCWNSFATMANMRILLARKRNGKMLGIRDNFGVLVRDLNFRCVLTFTVPDVTILYLLSSTAAFSSADFLSRRRE